MAGARREGDKGKAAVKYLLLQLPGKVVLFLVLLGLRSLLDWSWWAVGLVVGIWVLIDLALFPLVWRSYDPTAKGTAHNMVGLRGVAKERLAPDGYVSVRGELWRARAAGGIEIEAGQHVVVMEVDGLTIRVRPTEPAGGPPPTQS